MSYFLISIFLTICLLGRFNFYSLFNLIHVYLPFAFKVKVLYLGCYEEQPFDPLFPEEFLDYRYDIDWSTYPDMGVK